MMPSNYFDDGEQLDILVKRNETFKRAFLLEEQDIDGVYQPIPLTGATIVGGVKRNYDDPQYIKLFTFIVTDEEGGMFEANMDLGLAGGPKLRDAAWDVVVILASGRKIRCGAGFARISSGVAGVTA